VESNIGDERYRTEPDIWNSDIGLKTVESSIGDERYRTEPDIGNSDIGLKTVESDVRTDFGWNFIPISDIHHPNLWMSISRPTCVTMSVCVSVHVLCPCPSQCPCPCLCPCQNLASPPLVLCNASMLWILWRRRCGIGSAVFYF
jgi:hypothetical protein